MANSIKKARFYLPTDLIYHALLWLPIKTLIRFKSVCKAWSALIENPYFVEQYEKLQSVRELDPSYNYMFVTAYSPDYAKMFTILYFNDASQKLIELDTSYMFEMNFMNFCLVVGIANGLVCVCPSFCRQEIIICNPTTRLLRRIPPSFPKTPNSLVFLGFGWHVNDYKLVRIVCYFGYNNSPVLRGELYTKGTDIWREIEVKLRKKTWLWRLSIFRPNDCSQAVLINGVFYWKLALYDGCQFFWFDIHTGVFDVIETPLERCVAGDYKVYGIKDKLALIKCKQSSDQSMWIQNESMTNWTKVKIDFSAIPDYNSSRGGKIRVLGSTRNGELVLELRRDDNLKLILYDTDSQHITILHDVDVMRGTICNPYLYTPALTPVS